MIRIVKAAALAELRRQAAHAAELAERAADVEQQRQAAVTGSIYARQAQAKAEAAYRELLDDTLAGIARIQLAVADPLTGHAFQAEIALRILRRHIAEAKSSADRDTPASVRVLDALLGQDITLTRETQSAAPAGTEPAEGTRS